MVIPIILVTVYGLLGVNLVPVLLDTIFSLYVLLRERNRFQSICNGYFLIHCTTNEVCRSSELGNIYMQSLKLESFALYAIWDWFNWRGKVKEYDIICNMLCVWLSTRVNWLFTSHQVTCLFKLNFNQFQLGSIIRILCWQKYSFINLFDRPSPIFLMAQFPLRINV